MTVPEHRRPAGQDPIGEQGDDLTRLRVDVDDLLRSREHARRFEVDAIGDLARLRPLLDVLAQVRARPAGDAASPLLLAGPHGPILGFDDGGAVARDATYAEFERTFRGSREAIRERQREYVDLLATRGPVLDLGCGRGEFLEVLGEAGVEAWGVDLDEGMVAEAVAAGVDARVGDLFEELAARGAGSLAGIFCSQVIEHLDPGGMQRLVDEIGRVLAPQAVAVIETVNPHCLTALRFFWLDLTHVHPVYPESALMLAKAAGLGAAVVHFPGGSGVLEEDLASCGDFALITAHDPAALRTRGLLAC